MIKLSLTSDLHAGYSSKTDQIHQKFFQEMSQDKTIQGLILAGDLISHKQKSMGTLFRNIREAMPSIPIVACLGNHDWWDEGKYVGGAHHRKYSYDDLKASHSDYFTEYKIHYVGYGPLVIQDVAIMGFDGWYWSLNPPTNDKFWMAHGWDGEDPFQVLQKEALREFQNLMDMDTSAYPYRSIVGITHFPPFTDQVKYLPYSGDQKMMPHLTEKWDVLCVGHSHKACDFVENDCRVLNAGSDYDQPKYVTFEV